MGRGQSTTGLRNGKGWGEGRNLRLGEGWRKNMRGRCINHPWSCVRVFVCSFLIVGREGKGRVCV